MENEIKAGEYLRMLNGLIARIVTKDKDEHFILDRYYAGGRHLTEIEVKNDILNHSLNIIDLIEVGDYVNGYKVRATYLDGARHYIKLEPKDEKGTRVYDEDIKSIVTHEQFEQVCYKV